MNQILVTGATGKVGRQVVAALQEAGASFKALSRNPEAAGLPPGVEVLRGGLSDAASLEPCLEGIDTVFLVWTAPFPAAPAAIEAMARQARRIVLLSSPHRTNHPFFQQPNPMRSLFEGLGRLAGPAGLPHLHGRRAYRTPRPQLPGLGHRSRRGLQAGLNGATMIPLVLSVCLNLPAQAPPEAPKQPRQMEVKGVLSSTPVPTKMGDRRVIRAVSDPFLPGKVQYRIPLKPGQSILAEVRSKRPTFAVRIAEASGPETKFDELPQKTEVRKDRALYLNKGRRALEVFVQIQTTEIVSGEPYTLVLTEIDTEAYLKDPQPAPKAVPSSNTGAPKY